MLTLGLLINPVAGVGGQAGLKGSDGAAIQSRAAATGGRPRGAERAVRMLTALQHAPPARWLTWGGGMGADSLQRAGVAARVLGEPDSPPSAADTRTAAQTMLAAGVDLIVFCGGDGTARDVLDAIGRAVPVLGVPSGVKMHSGVFATTPEAAARIVTDLLQGGLVRAAVGEVRDIDEAALRAGTVGSRFYGELSVPEAGGFLQHTKEGGRENEALAVEEIVAEVVERLAEHPGPCLLGPGGTLAAIKRALGIDGTLLGVDVVAAGNAVATDVGATWLEDYLRGAGQAVLVLGFTRRQGFLLGRGNQQLTPAVLRRIGRPGLWVVGTRTKLLTLDGRPLLIDSDDPQLDRQWSGLVEVVTGYRDSLFYRLDDGSDLTP